MVALDLFSLLLFILRLDIDCDVFFFFFLVKIFPTIQVGPVRFFPIEIQSLGSDVVDSLRRIEVLN